jgi:hypothetical protein
LEPIALLGPAISLPVTVGADGTLTLEIDSRFRSLGTYTVTIGTDTAGAMGAPGRALAQGTFTITAEGPAPTLSVEPDHGFCGGPDPHVLVRGQNYPPGPSILLALFIPRDGGQTAYLAGTVEPDGTFAWPVRLVGCDPATPDGARFRINAIRRQHNVNPHQTFASATFTVSAATPPLPVLPTQPPDRQYPPSPALPTQPRGRR